MSVWTEAAIECLRDMRARGLAYSEMAKHFGVSRSAIAGKVARLGLPFGGGEDGGKARRLKACRGANTPRSIWTPERDSSLREMIARNATTRDVGAALGISRATAARRANILGLVWAKTVTSGPRPRRDPAAPRPKVDAKPTQKDSLQALEKVLERFLDPAPADAIPLIGRPFGRCAWPVGTPDGPADQLCCGRPVQDGSRFHYCETHYGASFRSRAILQLNVDKPAPPGTIGHRRNAA